MEPQLLEDPQLLEPASGPAVHPSPVREAVVSPVPEPPPQAVRTGRQELALYLAAGVAYIAISVFVTEVMRSWIGGFAFLLVCVWIVPALAKRLRR